MTGHDDLLKELDAALHVEPSRRFADDVKARVAAEARVRTRRMWWGLAAAASVSLATVALWRSPTVVPAALPAAPAQQASAAAVQDAEPERVIADGMTAPTPVVVRRVASASRPLPASSEPRLEVITNQGAVLRELWAGVGTAAMVEAVAEVAMPLPSVETKPIAPIVVEPIVVPPIVVTEIGKDPGREGAVPIIRRVDAAKETR